MWGESSKNCENGCQCSGLITESFKINSGNNATKRKQEEAFTTNFKLKMNPHSLDFKSPLSSPIVKSKRRILGEITNNSTDSPSRNIFGEMNTDSPRKSPLQRITNNSISTDSPSKRNIFGQMNTDSPRKSPLQRLNLEGFKSPFDKPLSPLQRGPTKKFSPLIDRTKSPLTTRTTTLKKSTTKISRIFEERTRFKMSCDENKENIGSLGNEATRTFQLEEETRDSFSYRSETQTVSNWSTMTKLDFTEALHETSTFSTGSVSKDSYVPEKDMENDLDPDLETLLDLEEEFEADNFDSCTKYEIISTDSPDIISRGRSSTSRKVNARNFVFGAPLADSEQSTSFNKPNANATRMLNFEDESFEFTSPAARRTSSSFSVKKSLKFSEAPKSPLRFTPTKTPTKLGTPNKLSETPSKSNQTPTRNPLRHERSDSSIGSMFSSPSSSHLRLFTSESTTSMESGFISEFEEPFLELEETKSNSPKMPNFNDLLSGQIKENFVPMKSFLKRPTLQRSLSFNPELKPKSLFAIQEKSPEGRKSQKRQESSVVNSMSKKRKAESVDDTGIVETEKPVRPVLHRCFSENHASIMSALSRSTSEPDLIGDFSLPYALPLTGGDHPDLKSISCETLAALLRGEYQESVHEYQVIDCRYPYEFEGGHIPGAHNLYTPRLVQNLLSTPQASSPDAKRNILVFHCEFSLERGPKLYRYLRSADRSKNMENYPHLNYPEIYLLHKGYRTFFQKYPELCTGTGYTAMLDPKHTHLLRKHRSIEEPTSFFTHHRKGGHRLMY